MYSRRIHLHPGIIKNWDCDQGRFRGGRFVYDMLVVSELYSMYRNCILVVVVSSPNQLKS